MKRKEWSVYDAIKLERDRLIGYLDELAMCEKRLDIVCIYPYLTFSVASMYHLHMQRIMEIELDAEKDEAIGNNNL